MVIYLIIVNFERDQTFLKILLECLYSLSSYSVFIYFIKDIKDNPNVYILVKFTGFLMHDWLISHLCNAILILYIFNVPVFLIIITGIPMDRICVSISPRRYVLGVCVKGGRET